MSNVNRYLGTSMSRPVSLSNGALVVLGGRDAVEASILDILSTEEGTRFFLPEYGSRLSTLLFEQNDTVLSSLTAHFVREALSKWEQRIRVEDVETSYNDEGAALVNIRYKILSSNEVNSFVYPFYTKLKH